MYLSADAVVIGDDQGLYVTTEFLNKIELSGLPPHLLTVKVGCVMMLLRNLNPKHGLCNGTRLLITSMTQRLIKGIVLTGSFQGTKCIIPRITLYPSNNPYAFKFGRRQFPLRHAYVMTINKSQGQTTRSNIPKNRIVITRCLLRSWTTLCGIFQMWISS